MDREKIKEAITIGVCFIKPWEGKIRCFDSRMGYGNFVDLTHEEYEIFIAAKSLSISEQIKRVDKFIEEG